MSNMVGFIRLGLFIKKKICHSIKQMAHLTLRITKLTNLNYTTNQSLGL